MYAVVVFVITGTEAAAPTAAVPEPETLPATRSRSSFSLAAMRTFPSAVRTAPSLELSPCSTNAGVDAGGAADAHGARDCEDLGRVARGDLDALRRGRAGVIAVDRCATVDVRVGLALEHIDDGRTRDAGVASARAACGEQEKVGRLDRLHAEAVAALRLDVRVATDPGLRPVGADENGGRDADPCRASERQAAGEQEHVNGVAGLHVDVLGRVDARAFTGRSVDVGA